MKIRKIMGIIFQILLLLIIIVGLVTYFRYGKIPTLEEMKQDMKKIRPRSENIEEDIYLYSKDERERMIKEGNRLVEEGRHWLEEGEHSIRRAQMYEEGKKGDREGLFHPEYQTGFVGRLRAKGGEDKKKGEVLIKKGRVLINKAQERKEEKRR